MGEIKGKHLIWIGIAGFGLMLAGAIGGAAVYHVLFDTRPEYLALPADRMPAAFSSFEQAQPATFQDRPDFVGASGKALRAVVNIKSKYDRNFHSQLPDGFADPLPEIFPHEFKERPKGVSSGSGVIISQDGYIATNYHVVSDAQEVDVLLNDNRTFKARVIGYDPATDLALVKIPAEGLDFLTFGNSDKVEVGQWVLAVGNPMDLNSTVTAGIISAKGRNINLLGTDTNNPIESFLQTDAVVNKGNSGGALVNADGELIGINTAIASTTGYYAGYSFAIPSLLVRKVMEDLLAYGEVKRGYLGVSILPVDADLAERAQLEVSRGAYVREVYANTGAEEAGIQKGDVIVSVNGKEVENSSQLQEAVGRYRPGDRVDIQALRGKQNQHFTVTLRSLDGKKEVEGLPGVLSLYGGSFRPITAQEKEVFGILNGILVANPGPLLEAQNIPAGFVITEVNGKPVSTLDDFTQFMQENVPSTQLRGYFKKGIAGSFRFKR